MADTDLPRLAVPGRLATATSRTGLMRGARRNLGSVDHSDTDAACRDIVRRLGARRLADADRDGRRHPYSTCARSASRAKRWRGTTAWPISSSPCRGWAWVPVSLFGSPAQREWLRRTRAGEAIAAFALSEPRSGSDVAQMETTARRDGNELRHRRREDLDLQRRHRRRLRAVRPHRRGDRSKWGRARHLRLSRARRHARY